MKEKLSSALGFFGIVLWVIISALLCYAPFIVLDIGYFWLIIALFVIYVFDFFGGILCIVLYVWAFIVAISGPIDTNAIIFFVFAAIYTVTMLIPSIIRLIIVLSPKSR